MLRRLFLAFLLAGPIACAGDAATDTLKVDLDAVVEQGRVSPVDGITAAGQPGEQAFRVFAENGYVAVIDMRTPGEERGLDEPATITGLGMEYIAFPIDSGDITFDKAQELDELGCVGFESLVPDLQRAAILGGHVMLFDGFETR